MGREKLIKNNGKLLLGVGILLALIGLFTLLIGAIPFFICFCVASICLIWFGVDYIKGENSKFVINAPNVLDLADDLYNNTVFENKFIIISQKAIATQKDISTVTDLNDVLAIYEYIQRMNGIVTSHTVNLELRNGKTLKMSIYARKKETKDDLVLTISKYCTNAMVGYSPEMLQYVSQARKQYKEKH